MNQTADIRSNNINVFKLFKLYLYLIPIDSPFHVETSLNVTGFLSRKWLNIPHMARIKTQISRSLNNLDQICPVKRLETKIIQKSLGAKNPKAPHHDNQSQIYLEEENLLVIFTSISIINISNKPWHGCKHNDYQENDTPRILIHQQN